MLKRTLLGLIAIMAMPAIVAQEVDLKIKAEGFGAKPKFKIYIDSDLVELKTNETYIVDQSVNIDKVARGRVILNSGKYGEFWLEPGNVEVTIKKSGFPKSIEVIGSETDNIYKSLKFGKNQAAVEKLIIEKPNHLATLNYIAQYYNRHSYDFLKSLYDKYPLETQQNLTDVKSFLKTAKLEKVKVGSKIFDFEASTQDGTTYNTNDLRGKYLLLDFASTGCAPCWEGYPSMIETMSNYPDVAVLTFNQDNAKEGWNNMAKRFQIELDWPVLWDAENKKDIFKLYEIEGWPIYFLISPEGVVLERWFGAGKSKLKGALKKHITD